VGSRPDYDTSLIVFRRVTKDCFVSYDGNYYSVPWAYARKSVELKETEEGQLIVLHAGAGEIARHDVVHGHNQRVVVAAHYDHIHRQARPARPPMAVQVPRRDDGLPPAPEVEVRPLSWYDQVVEAMR